MTARLATLLAVLCLLAVAGCGDDGDADGAGSGGDVQLDAGVVAKVGDVEIEEGDLEQQVDALVRAQRPATGGSPGGPQQSRDALRRQLREQALAALLMAEAIEQEAADRGIEVSKAEVAQRWRSARSDQFKTKRALRRFLGGQTEQDLLRQLRLQSLSERIDQQVVAEAGGGKQGAKALERFQAEFRKRWTERTTCAEGYATTGCAEPVAKP